MESLGSIMTGMASERTGRRASSLPTTISAATSNDDAESYKSCEIRSDDERARKNPDTPKPEICEFCGAPRYHKGVTFGEFVIWMPFAMPCTCPEGAAAYEKARAEEQARAEAEKRAKEEAQRQERIRRIIGESGMGERFQRRTFATFQITDDNKKAAAVAKRYADNFESLLPKRGADEPGRNGLFISGPPGTGKTHLAAAIANQLMAEGRSVVCMTMIDLLDRIKRTFSSYDSQQNESNVLGIYKSVPLLVIDDIGKEPPTEWAISTIYNIINGRYEAYLPIIVTTNYDSEALVQRMTPRDTRDDSTALALIDRLRGMCRGLNLTGQSWRRK